MMCQYTESCDRSIGIQGLANAWLRNGGSAVYVDKMVAIAMAESCGDPLAVSEACAVGCWQIESNVLIPGRPSISELYDVGVNAQWAIDLSDNGDNVAAWDVAYAAGESLTRVGYLHDIQEGSAAWYFLQQVQSALGSAVTTNIPSGANIGVGIQSLPQVVTPPQLEQTQPPPVVTPPTPQISVNLIDNPAQYSEARSGWDAVTWHYTNDVPYYSGYDAEIVRRLSTLTGG